MDENTKRLLDNIYMMIEEVANYDPGDLAKGKDLGPFHFKDHFDLIKDSINLCKHWKLLPLDPLMPKQIEQIHASIKTLKGALNQIAKFSLVNLPSPPPPEGHRDKCVNELQNAYDHLYPFYQQHVPFLTIKSGLFQSTLEQSQKLSEKITKETNTTLNEAKDKLNEMESIVRAAKVAAGEVGVTKFAKKFGDISEKYYSSSKTWLWVSVVIGFLTIVTAFSFIFIFPANGDLANAMVVQRIITKLVVLSILYFAVIWSGKIYKTQRHLAVVNEHRQNALDTFETFIKAASDEDIQTKNAILLETTRCIFSPSVTGFLSKESEETPSSRVIEILKDFGPKSIS